MLEAFREVRRFAAIPWNVRIVTGKLVLAHSVANPAVE
jgi:hypothetical protein